MLCCDSVEWPAIGWRRGAVTGGGDGEYRGDDRLGRSGSAMQGDKTGRSGFNATAIGRARRRASFHARARAATVGRALKYAALQAGKTSPVSASQMA